MVSEYTHSGLVKYIECMFDENQIVIDYGGKSLNHSIRGTLRMCSRNILNVIENRMENCGSYEIRISIFSGKLNRDFFVNSKEFIFIPKEIFWNSF